MAISLSTLQKQAPTLVSLVLLAGITWTLAGLIWELVTPLDSVVPVDTSDGPPGPLRGGDNGDELQRLVELQLFGDATEAPDTAPIEAPETQLDLELRGILAGDTPETSRAIIANKNEERSYTIGSFIQSGIKVHSIFPDRIIIDRRGNLETLRLPVDYLDGASMPVSYGSQSTSDNTVNIDNLTAKIGVDASKLTDIIRAIPVSRGGEQIGFRIFPGRLREDFVKLGLESGDIVTEINGIPLNDPSAGLQAFETLSPSDSITLTIERDGQPQTMVLPTTL